VSSRPRGIVIAIDGPSGAGKSTVGRALAGEFGYAYLDTGAMYRAVAWRARDEGVDPGDVTRVTELAATLDVAIEDAGRRILIRVPRGFRDISEDIRSRDIAKAASLVAKIPGVRRELVRRQQEMGSLGGAVLDGRDIGTVVFPDAEAKFYLDAAAEKRARRRADELAARGQPSDYDAILDETVRRDRQDMLREDSPLQRAEDALYIDTTDLSADAVVQTLVAHARRVMTR
jgi:cytidylate kinase